MSEFNLETQVNEDFIPINNSNEIDFLKSKPHPFIAGVFDFYILSTLINTVLALISSISGKTYSSDIATIGFIVLFVICLLTVILYHRKVTKRVLWLSPGEQMAGRTIADGEKVWINPYYCNRWALFIIMMISVIIMGNEWDGISSGYTYPIGTAIGKSISLTLQAYGLMLMGRGKLKGALFLIAIYTIGFVSAFIYMGANAYFKYIFISFGILLALYSIVVISYYYVSKKYKDRE